MLRPSIFTDNYVDDVFDGFFRDPFWGSAGTRAVSVMKTDIKDLGDSYQIDMDLPGFSKDDVTAELKKGYLTVTAEHSSENEDDCKGKYVRKERFSGHYQRSFYIGDQVKQEDITASFKDGVLKLDVPKKEKKPETCEGSYISIEG